MIGCWTRLYCNCCVNISPKRGLGIEPQTEALPQKQANHNIMKANTMKWTLLVRWKNLILCNYRTCSLKDKQHSGKVSQIQYTVHAKFQFQSSCAQSFLTV